MLFICPLRKRREKNLFLIRLNRKCLILAGLVKETALYCKGVQLVLITASIMPLHDSLTGSLNKNILSMNKISQTKYRYTVHGCEVQCSISYFTAEQTNPKHILLKFHYEFHLHIPWKNHTALTVKQAKRNMLFIKESYCSFQSLEFNIHNFFCFLEAICQGKFRQDNENQNSLCSVCS